jgi:uncharacterized membrane protein YphA (DoxX/SURF4 family)
MIQLGFLSSYGDAWQLLLRVILGFIMVVQGAPKLFGPARPTMRGGMTQLGIHPVLFDLVGSSSSSAASSSYWG